MVVVVAAVVAAVLGLAVPDRVNAEGEVAVCSMFTVDGTCADDGWDGGDRPQPELSPTPDPDVDARPDGLAHDDLAQGVAATLAVDLDAVRVVEFEEVDWPDGSLGCGQPGQSYTMAVEPGYRMVVEVDGEQITYHGSYRTGNHVRCDQGGARPDPRPEPPPVLRS